METDNELNMLVQSEAKKSGISSKDARKALKKLRAGGMMAQIAPQLQNTFMEMNPNVTPKDKLRAKMKKMQESRSSKCSKEQAYEKLRKEVHERQEHELEEKERKKKADAQKRKNHSKKLRLLEKQIGVVTQEMYNGCMTRLKENEYVDDGVRCRDRNIIELYGKQQEFSNDIKVDDMDDI